MRKVESRWTAQQHSNRSGESTQLTKSYREREGRKVSRKCLEAGIVAGY